MEWERKARKALVSPELVYFLWLAKMATPRTGHKWPKSIFKSKIFVVNPYSNQICQFIFKSKSLLLPVAQCPFNRGKWSTALHCEWNTRCASLQNLGQMSFILHTCFSQGTICRRDHSDAWYVTHILVYFCAAWALHWNLKSLRLLNKLACLQKW